MNEKQITPQEIGATILRLMAEVELGDSGINSAVILGFTITVKKPKEE